MIKMTIQDTEETAEFKVLEKPIIQKPLIAESDVVTIDNNLSTYVTGTQKRELTVGLGYLDSVGYETLRRIRDRQYAVLKYPTVTITADEPVDLGYGEDVPSYRQRLVQLKGKNLFDKDNANISHFYSLTTAFAQSASAITIVIPVNAGDTYTISSTDRALVDVSANITYTDKIITSTSDNWLGRTRWESSDTAVTTIAPTGSKFMYAYVKWSSNATAIADTLATIQIEKGTTATTYEPYTDIELCKLGDYQDYIYKSGDKWYVHKAVGHDTRDVEINGIADNNNATPTTVSPSGTFDFGNWVWNPDYATTAANAILSSNIGTFKLDANLIGNAAARAMESGTFCQRQGTNDRVYFRNTGYAGKTGNEVRAILLANSGGTNLWWYLATPTETEITNATLKAQLNALQNSAFDRWTKVETNVQEPSLQPYLTVTQGEITGSGKEVMLEGTTEDLLDFVILGDTSQQTYTGKNLFNVQNGSYKSVTMTVNADGSINLSGTASANAYLINLTKPITLMENGATYICSWSGADSLPSGVEIRLGINNGNSWVRNLMSAMSGTTKSRTLTANTDGGDSIRCEIYVANGSNASVSNIKIQLEKSSTATPFEPYVGGVPAPNPSYPQEVRTVNGNINFDFSGPSGVKKYTMVGKMTLAEQRIIDNCGTNEQVQVSFRESKQL